LFAIFEKEGYYFLTKKLKKLAQEPLSLNEAIAVCNEYQHLKGHIVLGDNNNFEVIDCVTIAPYGKLNQLLFFKLYKEMNDLEKAIRFYELSQYSVIIILRQLVADGDYYLKYVELDTYLSQSGASLNIISQFQKGQ
jgi:hypothetical protein